MTESKHFKKQKYTKKEISELLTRAERSLHIAQEDRFLEVRFAYTYTAFIQLGLVLLSHNGLRLRSQPGHHIFLIKKIAEYLSDDAVESIGNVMRQKRNRELYGGGVEITQKECNEFFAFVQDVACRVRQMA